MMSAAMKQKTVVGWREWLALPALGIERIKVKMDTGARTSALHAFDLSTHEKDQQSYVHFQAHPIQQDDSTIIQCEALILDQRWIINSGGQRELRYVIETPMLIAGESWPIEITLTNRDSMGFRMLLGRTAMEKRLTVDPSLSFVLGGEDSAS